ncbi:hypothetical protein ASG88_13865 [Nocardioides sp. Soil777]|uniref:hypothetical protein n=1 Tax=Nocardioides sp. Soil777 TaxID=1736409 RepID=UPI0007030B10|nr:hypothetical protein [Nocardioides sp. Soil777]KRE99688.1 hypothetical protein ASG88_13865 [Nocardioides sp. Soil777]
MSPQSPGNRQANDADRRYLDQVLPSVRTVTALSVQAGQSTDPGIRGLARLTAATQRARGRTAVRLVSSWTVRDADGPRPPLPTSRGKSAPVTPLEDGHVLDLRYLADLHEHALASLASARTEMVEGINRQGRRIAEDSIRAHSRELAAIEGFTFTGPAPARPPED